MVGKTLLPETRGLQFFRCSCGICHCAQILESRSFLERFTTVQSVLHLQIMLLTVVW
uniref:Uncharacterized protein n=1 Tax=Anguilla anguilla TaxID=7936 RepID=A0A0E9QY39_ANGAN